jgi:hypothetical protein
VRLAFPDQFTMYESTAPGLPVPDNRGLFDLINDWVFVSRKQRGLPEDQRMTLEIKQATGWSERTIAQALKTTHPTIGKLLDGQRTSWRVRKHLSNAYEVVRRTSLLTRGDPLATDRILRTNPSNDRPSAFEELANGNFASAYLAAVDVLRPRREGLMRGRRPSTPGRATVALFDED